MKTLAFMAECLRRRSLRSMLVRLAIQSSNWRVALTTFMRATIAAGRAGSQIAEPASDQLSASRLRFLQAPRPRFHAALYLGWTWIDSARAGDQEKDPDHDEETGRRPQSGRSDA